MTVIPSVMCSIFGYKILYIYCDYDYYFPRFLNFCGRELTRVQHTVENGGLRSRCGTPRDVATRIHPVGTSIVLVFNTPQQLTPQMRKIVCKGCFQKQHLSNLVIYFDIVPLNLNQFWRKKVNSMFYVVMYIIIFSSKLLSSLLL